MKNQVQVLTVNLDEDGEFSEYFVEISEECLNPEIKIFGVILDSGDSIRVYVAPGMEMKIPEYKQEMLNRRIKVLGEDFESRFQELLDLEQKINMHKKMQEKV